MPALRNQSSQIAARAPVAQRFGRYGNACERSRTSCALARLAAYALPTLTREERADRAKVAISAPFNSKQQAFLNSVLAHYLGAGVDELDQEKLTPLLRLKYLNSISDAIADLGRPEEISRVFVGFQKYLYESVA
jgi:hypothetical protein